MEWKPLQGPPHSLVNTASALSRSKLLLPVPCFPSVHSEVKAMVPFLTSLLCRRYPTQRGLFCLTGIRIQRQA
ncbi:hypothetical protein BD311DRAFT_116732 [Dichomitus squalens]|uniref:Uncharacterized protein n=1 Tax=Dichomitus squalens TaxID=114155 RepID=A0A4Q9MVG5_9APHY|nr:hypothetical protein BD311DRAFT_116732 [Dichomitus squalens]